MDDGGWPYFVRPSATLPTSETSATFVNLLLRVMMSGDIVGHGDGLVRPKVERRADRLRPYAWRRWNRKVALLRHREPVLFKLSAEHVILTLQAFVVSLFVPAMAAAAIHVHSEKTRPAKIDKETRNEDTNGERRYERHKTLYKIHNVHFSIPLESKPYAENSRSELSVKFDSTPFDAEDARFGACGMFRLF